LQLQIHFVVGEDSYTSKAIQLMIKYGFNVKIPLEVSISLKLQYSLG